MLAACQAICHGAVVSTGLPHMPSDRVPSAPHGGGAAAAAPRPLCTAGIRAAAAESSAAGGLQGHQEHGPTACEPLCPGGERGAGALGPTLLLMPPCRPSRGHAKYGHRCAMCGISRANPSDAGAERGPGGAAAGAHLLIAAALRTTPANGVFDIAGAVCVCVCVCACYGGEGDDAAARLVRWRCVPSPAYRTPEAHPGAGAGTERGHVHPTALRAAVVV